MPVAAGAVWDLDTLAECGSLLLKYKLLLLEFSKGNKQTKSLSRFLTAAGSFGLQKSHLYINYTSVCKMTQTITNPPVLCAPGPKFAEA